MFNVTAKHAPRRRLFSGLSRQTYVWAVVALVLGIFVTAQLQTAPAEPPMDADYPRNLTAATIERLEEQQDQLKQQISDLRKQIAVQQEQSAKDKASFAEISQALKREQVLAGLTPLVGPGIVVTIDDSTRKVPPGDEPDWYIVHEHYLRDTVNLLWANGAEAISINDERIVNSTSIYCVGSTILINSTRLSPPYVFSVIGDAPQMIAALENPASLPDFKRHVRDYGVQFKYEPVSEITVPAFDGTLYAKYAQPGVGQ